MRALPIVIVAVAAAGCATAPKQDAAAEQESLSAKASAGGGAAPATPVPGGIAEPEGGRLYLRAADGIEAVEAATGNTVWRTSNARWPLAVSDSYLAAGAVRGKGEVQLSLHDRHSGALLSLGPVVETGSTDGLRAAFCAEGQIELHWGRGSGVRADLLRRVVEGPAGPPSNAVHRAGEAHVGDLLLRGEGGHLRAYTSDGLLRWERPLDLERHSSR